jgi:hypothetical protein
MTRNGIFLVIFLLLSWQVYCGPAKPEATDPLDRLGIEVSDPTVEEIQEAFKSAVRDYRADEFPEILVKLESARDDLIISRRPTRAENFLPPNHRFWSTPEGANLMRLFSELRNLEREKSTLDRQSRYTNIAGAWGAGLSLTAFWLTAAVFLRHVSASEAVRASMTAAALGFMIPNFMMEMKLDHDEELILRTQRAKAMKMTRMIGLVAGGLTAVGFSACAYALLRLAH